MTDNANIESVDERIASWNEEYNSWLKVLEPYHSNRFDINYRQYTAYTSTRGTTTKISDPVAPELVERVVQKIFERNPKPYVRALGFNLPKEITQVVEGTLVYMWDDPAVVQASGTMRSKMKLVGREFTVAGQAGTETFWNEKAGAPDVRTIPIEDVIFDPASTLKRSNVYYIRQFVSIDYLEDYEEVTEDGEIKSGVFKNIDELKRRLKDKENSKKDDPTAPRVNRSGAELYSPTVDEILLVTRWEGKKCVRIADWNVVIQEYENDILDDDPLDFAMDIEVPKEPYAFSLLDFLNGLTKAKDLILNQVVDYGSKALNPPLFVDPAISAVNKQTLRNAFKVGGLVFARPDQANHLPMPALPAVGFDLMNYIQQRAESSSGISAYLGGITNSESDKTAGTASGIQSLIAQSITPVRDRQLNLEESIVEPVINKMLKYAAALMGKDEMKYVFITGEAPRWVTVTRNMLRGQITLKDLVVAELVPVDVATEMAQEMIQNGKDPESEILFDVDWVVRVEAGSMAEQDTEKDIQSFDGWVAFNTQLGIPMDLQAVSKERGLRSGIKEPDQYLAQQQGMPGGMMQGGPEVNGITPPGSPAGMPQGAPQAPAQQMQQAALPQGGM